MQNVRSARWMGVVLMVSAGIFVLGGCVERKLTINTEPSGALVILNDEEIGDSPVTLAFSWYGDYKVRISKDGFETLDTHRKLKAPTHDKFPFDFFYEILWPKRIVDEYEWTFALVPFEQPKHEELVKAAKEFRKKAIQTDTETGKQ